MALHKRLSEYHDEAMAISVLGASIARAIVYNDVREVRSEIHELKHLLNTLQDFLDAD